MTRTIVLALFAAVLVKIKESNLDGLGRRR
jgi:hypothetical protein